MSFPKNTWKMEIILNKQSSSDEVKFRVIVQL